MIPIGKLIQLQLVRLSQAVKPSGFYYLALAIITIALAIITATLAIIATTLAVITSTTSTYHSLKKISFLIGEDCEFEFFNEVF